MIKTENGEIKIRGSQADVLSDLAVIFNSFIEIFDEKEANKIINDIFKDVTDFRKIKSNKMIKDFLKSL